MPGHFYFQYAVVEAGFNLVLVDRIREPEGTLEAAVAALHHAKILLLLIMLVLLLTSDRQDAVLEGERDILLVDPRKFGLNYDFLIGLPYVHMWGERKASASARAEHARESWEPTHEAVKQAIHLRSEGAEGV